MGTTCSYLLFTVSAVVAGGTLHRDVEQLGARKEAGLFDDCETGCTGPVFFWHYVNKNCQEEMTTLIGRDARNV